MEETEEKGMKDKRKKRQKKSRRIRKKRICKNWKRNEGTTTGKAHHKLPTLSLSHCFLSWPLVKKKVV